MTDREGRGDDRVEYLVGLRWSYGCFLFADDDTDCVLGSRGVLERVGD